MSEEIKIAVAGTGYVGLRIATLLAQHHPVTAVDVIRLRLMERPLIVMPISSLLRLLPIMIR